MGNGFPVAGVLINPDIGSKYGMLGTTFGGNHLACAASLAVLDVIESEDLIVNAKTMGDYLINNLKSLPDAEVRGKGLMIGIETRQPIKKLRNTLMNDYHILTGVAKNPNVLRLLPPLSLQKNEVDYFIKSIKTIFTQ